MNTDIHNYYEKIASVYDEDRFGNSYGKYIHKQEQRILNSLNLKNNNRKVLDLACGTGRFLNYATHGIDFSQKMIEQAKIKFPEKLLKTGGVDHTGFEENFFDDIFSFHLLMHLTDEKTQLIIEEVHKILKKGGRFIFDVPSKKRRKLLNHQQAGWHGAHNYSLHEIKDLLGQSWEIKFVRGILFFPVHRIPVMLRNPVRFLDTLLCQSPIKEYSSYLIVIAEKK